MRVRMYMVYLKSTWSIVSIISNTFNYYQEFSVRLAEFVNAQRKIQVSASSSLFDAQPCKLRETSVAGCSSFRFVSSCVLAEAVLYQVHNVARLFLCEKRYVNVSPRTRSVPTPPCVPHLGNFWCSLGAVLTESWRRRFSR